MRQNKFPELAKKLKELREQILNKKKEIIVLHKQLSDKVKNEKNTDRIINSLCGAFYNKSTIALDYRYHHVAYCEMRGRKRKQIETNFRETTKKLDEKKIAEIKIMFGQ